MNGKWRKGKGPVVLDVDEGHVEPFRARRQRRPQANTSAATIARPESRIITPLGSPVARCRIQRGPLAAHHPAQVIRPASRWIHPPRMV